MITVEVRGRVATKTATEVVTSGSVGQRVKFVFSGEEWEHIGRVVNFSGQTSIDQYIDENGEAVIPWECVEKPGKPLTVGIYGVNEHGTVVIPTIYCNLGMIRRGAELTVSTKHQATVEAVGQMLAAASRSEGYADQAMQSAMAARADADEAAGIAGEVFEAYQSGDLKGEPGDKGDPFRYEDFTPEQLESLRGEDGYTPVKGVDYFDGQDGYTPVKGVDYFDGKDYVITEADYSAIADTAAGKLQPSINNLDTRVTALNALIDESNEGLWTLSEGTIFNRTMDATTAYRKNVPNKAMLARIKSISGVSSGAKVDKIIVNRGNNVIDYYQKNSNMVYPNGIYDQTRYIFPAGTYTSVLVTNDGSQLGLYYASASSPSSTKVSSDSTVTFTINEPFCAWFYRSGLGDISFIKSWELIKLEAVEYPIPESIRNLSGYGNANAVVDFVKQQYTSPNGTVTDISQMLADSPLTDNIKAGTGATIEFHQSGTSVAIPSVVEYLVKANLVTEEMLTGVESLADSILEVL